MAKTMSEVLTEMKGAGNEKENIGGKAPFSQAGFSTFVSALANDNNFTLPKYDKKTGTEDQVSISALLRSDAKKTITNAQYPQKSELDVLNTSDVATSGIAQAIPHIVNAYIQTGRKFELPDQKDQTGYIYLENVSGKTKEVPVRDMKTQEVTGSTVIETENHTVVKAKATAPKWLTKKTRKDVNGNVIKK